MIRVYQDHFSRDGDHGDCWNCCVASLVGCPLSEVPDTRGTKDGSWFFAIRRWLHGRGLDIKSIGRRQYGEDYPAPKGWSIATGESPRGVANGHAVVYFDGKLFHDPHPEGSGLTGKPQEYFTVFKLEKRENTNETM